MKDEFKGQKKWIRIYSYMSKRQINGLEGVPKKRSWRLQGYKVTRDSSWQWS